MPRFIGVGGVDRKKYMQLPSNPEPTLGQRIFHIMRIVLSLTVGLLIAWVVGSATWNVWGVPGVPFLKGIILFIAGMVGYFIMDRRIMGESTKRK